MCSYSFLLHLVRTAVLSVLRETHNCPLLVDSLPSYSPQLPKDVFEVQRPRSTLLPVSTQQLYKFKPGAASSVPL
jgi:hypothetical protein